MTLETDLYSLKDECLRELSNEPLLQTHINDIRKQVDNTLNDLLNCVPSSPAELGIFCSELNTVLTPFIEERDEYTSPRKRSPFNKVLRRIAKMRKEASKIIMQHQRSKKEWTRLSYKTREETLTSVEGVVSAYLNIPTETPPMSSKDWHRVRRSILNIGFEDLREWGLAGAFFTEGREPYFESFLDALAIIYNEEYDVAIELREKKRNRVYKWGTRDETLDNVRSRVAEQMDLPESPKIRHSSEWDESRQRIIGVRQCDLVDWGLAGAFSNNKWFRTTTDLMIAAFDEDYDVAEEFEGRRSTPVFRWRGLEEAASNVRATVLQEMKIFEIPARESEEWKKLRGRLVQLRQRNLNEWGLAHAFLKKGGRRNFQSYRDALRAAFPEMQLDAWCFKSVGRVALKLAAVDTENRIEASEFALIERIVTGDTSAQGELMSMLFAISVKGSHSIEYGEQITQAFENVLESIRVMGVECPVNFTVLWRVANSYIRNIALYQRLKHRELRSNRVSRKDGAPSLECVEQADNTVDLSLILNHLEGIDVAVVDQFLRGEIDFEDAELQRVISELRDELVS